MFASCSRGLTLVWSKALDFGNGAITLRSSAAAWGRRMGKRDKAMKLTISVIKARAKHFGIRAKWNAEWQEWNIEGYMTDSHEDALEHINYIAAHR